MRQLMFASVLVFCFGLVEAGAQTVESKPELNTIRADAPAPRLKIDLSRLDLVDRSRADQRLFGFDAQTTTRSSSRSATRKILGAIVGATGGFFAGGYTGALIEGDDCHCDDPGLKGALIGAPIGALVGGILGGLYLF